MRYEEECIIIGELAKEALNKPKNVVKSRFEDMPMNEIIDKLREEINELIDELDPNYWESKVCEYKLDHYKIRSELADSAACLVGILVKVIEIHIG